MLCPEHVSGSDLLERGFIKWNSQGLLDMHTKSAASNQPDWFTRRVGDIRTSDLKYTHHWAYDRSLKANGIMRPSHLAGHREPWFFIRELDTRKPQRINGDLPPIRYAQYSPPRRQMPNRPEFLRAVNGHQC